MQNADSTIKLIKFLCRNHKIVPEIRSVAAQELAGKCRNRIGPDSSAVQILGTEENHLPEDENGLCVCVCLSAKIDESFAGAESSRLIYNFRRKPIRN